VKVTFWTAGSWEYSGQISSLGVPSSCNLKDGRGRSLAQTKTLHDLFELRETCVGSKGGSILTLPLSGPREINFSEIKEGQWMEVCDSVLIIGLAKNIGISHMQTYQ